VFSLHGRIEIFVEEVKGLLIFPVQNYFDHVLQVNLHFVVLEVVAGFLGVSVFGGLRFGFQAENRPCVINIARLVVARHLN
jgi:hypothetical protein